MKTKIEGSKKGFKRSNSEASDDSKPVFSRSLANKIANAAKLKALAMGKSLNTSVASSEHSSSQHRSSRGGGGVANKPTNPVITSYSIDNHRSKNGGAKPLAINKGHKAGTK